MMEKFHLIGGITKMSKWGSYVVSLNEVQKHPNADKLGIVKLDDPFEAQVIINLDDWKGKDKAVWILPDSVTGDNEVFDWYGRNKKTKTVKLRGLMSYGFFVEALPHHVIGDEVSKDFGVTKYEEPVKFGPTSLKGGDAAKPPKNAPKFTDIENIRNTKYSKDLFLPGEEVVVLEKIDGCLHGDTLVATPDGSIKIRDIEPGLEVLSYNQTSRKIERDVVDDKMIKMDVNAVWMKLVFDGGNELICTTNHPILTTDGYVQAIDLNEKYDIISY